MPSCPICGRPSEADTSRFRPFCSARCVDIDLGRWFTGAYAVPAASDIDDDPAPSEPHDRA